MMKLNAEQLKEANALLKRLVAKTKKMDPDVVASAVIGLCARMCYQAGSGSMEAALGFSDNMALDVRTMIFNLDTAVKVQKDEADKRLRH